MNIKELKALIADVPDDAILVAPGQDHYYRDLVVELGTACRESPRRLTEDYGEKVMPEAVYGKRINVLIMR